MGKKTENIFERARNNLRENRHENALRLFNEVLNREPKHLKALRSKALIKILNSHKKEAEEFLLFAIEQQPEDDQLCQMLGTFYYNNDKPQKALEQLKQAIKLNPENVLAHKCLGMLYAHTKGEHEKAIKHFSKAIDEAKNATVDIFFNRGCSFMILNKMEAAEKDLQKAEELDHSQAKEMLDNYF
jgi:tetratricopeptide (TPR) repeat protein